MLFSKQMSMQETNLSLSQIIALSDGYSIHEVWDSPYPHYPKGIPLKELWPLCSWRREESVFFQLFTWWKLCFHIVPTLLIFYFQGKIAILSFSTFNLSHSGLFLAKRTHFFSKEAIFSCNSLSNIMILPWLDPFGNTEMWKRALGSHGDEQA